MGGQTPTAVVSVSCVVMMGNYLVAGSNNARVPVDGVHRAPYPGNPRPRVHLRAAGSHWTLASLDLICTDTALPRYMCVERGRA